MGTEPQGRKRKFTDDQLRTDLKAGLTPPEIADKYKVSRQAVNKRVNQLEQTTVAAVVAPQESRRFVSHTIDAMEELTRCLQRVNKLQDACDEYLQDADQPDKYDIGPRGDEVMVTFRVVTGETERGRKLYEKRKASLAYLLAQVRQLDEDICAEIISAETKHADPRDLILRTSAECRQTVSTAAELAKMLADARIMQAFREAMLEEIAKESPDCARRIAEAVRRKLILNNAFRGPDTVPGG